MQELLFLLVCILKINANDMKKNLFAAHNDWTGLIVRLTIGVILFPHGAQKALGLFGGFGFNATLDYFTGTLHLPWLISFLIVFIEFAGSVLLLAGAGSRIWAALVVVLMTGIIFTSHIHNGFFMNWFGNQKGEGYEFHLLVIGLSVAVLVNGSGKYSVDKLISKM